MGGSDDSRALFAFVLGAIFTFSAIFSVYAIAHAAATQTFATVSGGTSIGALSLQCPPGNTDISIVRIKDPATSEGSVGFTACPYSLSGQNLDTYFSATDGTYYVFVYGAQTHGGGVSDCDGLGYAAADCLATADNYTVFTRTSGVWSTPDSNTNTRIISLDPADGSTTASTAVSVNIGYYVASTTGFDTVGFTIVNLDQNYAQEARVTAPAVYDGDAVVSTTTILRSGGAYQLQAFILNSSTGAVMFSDSTASGANNLGNANFSVVSNPFPGYIGTTSPEAAYSLATSTCTVFNPSGCFQNAIVWAFYPNPSILQLIAQDGDTIKTRPPAGWLFVNIAVLQNLGATSSAQFALVEDWPIMHYIFQPFATALAGVIWFLFAVWFFMHVRHINL